MSETVPRLGRRVDQRQRRPPAERDLAAETGAALRISVKGGGCSGFQYAFDIETTRADDDFVATRDGATVVVDPVSLEMMRGSELDFVDDLMGQSFGSRTRTPSPPAAAG